VPKNEVGVEFRPSVVTRRKIYGRPTIFPLFSLLSLPLSSSLSQPPHLGDKLESFWPHGLAAWPPTLAARPATPWLPYKRAANGSLLLHPTN
jgi:hypothetical protein